MNDAGVKPAPATVGTADWKGIVLEFQEPSRLRANWQVINTLGPYAFMWYLIFLSKDSPWWQTIPLAMVAGALLVRVFIIFHDCGHGSFYRSRRANDAVGFFCGLLTFTPYYHWRWEHSVHHATTGDLDRRGMGDIWTMTVQEYLESSRWKRFAYRLARNPLVLFVLAPVYLFVIEQRFPTKSASQRERDSVWWMNLAIAAFVGAMCLTFGIKEYLLIQLTVTMVAGASGIWLFYVQHQFEDAYWETREDWDYTEAALKGSSYYKLPRVLQWLSGNIGFHHIHHLSSRIPNYNLERCHNSHPIFQQVEPITLRSSLKSINVRLWDTDRRKLVGFSAIKGLPRRPKSAQDDEATAKREMAAERN